MNELLGPIIVAVIAAVPGMVALLNARRDKRRAEEQIGQKTWLDGYGSLTDQLQEEFKRLELAAERRDQRIADLDVANARCEERAAELTAQVGELRGTIELLTRPTRQVIREAVEQERRQILGDET